MSNSEFEAWTDFRQGELVDNRQPGCRLCGRPCSGDTTITDTGEPVCDDAADCDGDDGQPSDLTEFQDFEQADEYFGCYGDFADYDFGD